MGDHMERGDRNPIHLRQHHHKAARSSQFIRWLWTHEWAHLRSVQLSPAYKNHSNCWPQNWGCGIGEMILGRLLPPGHCTDNGPRHIVFLQRRCFFLSWSFSLGGSLQVWHTLMAYDTALKECRLWMPSWRCPLPSSSSLVSSRRELIHSSGALIFATATPPGNTSRFPGSGG